jgi:tRNA dimethylallyltransferase
MTHQSENDIAIMGATATGKSELAIRIAEKYDGEVISMDSRQVYRGLNIGTGKISLADQRRVPHHLIDILDPREQHTAAAHLKRALEARDEIRARGRMAIYAGGTGLYFRVLFRGLMDLEIPEDQLVAVRRALADKPTEDLLRELEEVDPQRAAGLAPRDRVRIQRGLEIYRCTGRTYTDHVTRQKEPRHFNGLKIVLSMPRPRLRDRIARRTGEMYAEGWGEEVRGLLERGVPRHAPAMASLGYDVIAEAIERGKDPTSTLEAVIAVTQQYAKRQETFFRSEEQAQWFDVTRPETAQAIDRQVRTAGGL